MPHLAMEYSANLDGKVDFRALVRAAHEAMISTGLFELGGIRVRAFRSDAYAIGDLVPDNAFIDMSLRIGAGRSEDKKKRAGAAIFAAVSSHVSHLLETPHFMLSFEIREIDKALSWKENTIHPRLRASTQQRER
ncbi:5-carboxymethyl-2-hydroxymuconate Delta-isomerase [Microbacteriaceae bacterium K1510]|nr:5-carboxymethyl-2-hydroxymuconate Delta-isomerase [Microbacteriaceae bacterium K1510]